MLGTQVTPWKRGQDGMVEPPATGGEEEENLILNQAQNLNTGSEF